MATSDINKQLWDAAAKGDLPLVMDLVGRGADVNWGHPDVVSIASASCYWLLPLLVLMFL
jgi:hypothetical protein